MVYSGSNNKVLLALQVHSMAEREEHVIIYIQKLETFLHKACHTILYNEQIPTFKFKPQSAR